MASIFDRMAAEYGFTLHYTAKLTPYQVKALAEAAEARKYSEIMLEFNVHALAANGTEASVDKFFASIRPKSQTPTTLGDPFAGSF